jgi:hypothetical protein
MSTTAACLVASLVVTCGFLIAGFVNSRHGLDDWSSTLVAAVSAYIVAFAVIVSLAIPFRFLAKRWHFARGWMVVTIGTTVGLLLVASFHYVFTHTPILADDRHKPFVVMYVEFGLIGAVGGAVFWACCKREMRPNSSLERTRDR